MATIIRRKKTRPATAINRIVPLRERMLLIIAGLFVALNEVSLTLTRGEPLLELWPIAVWLVCAAGLHMGFNRMLPNRDPFILPLVLLLGGWGVTLVARLAPAFATRQAIWLAVGSAATIATAALPISLRVLRRYRYTWLLVGLSLLAATLLFGVNPSGFTGAPRLWLGFRILFFQPSEILKLLLIVFLASYLSEKREILSTTHLRVFGWRIPALSYVGPMLLMWGFCVVLLIWQRDLGAASLFFLIFLGMLYVSTDHGEYMLLGLGLLLLVSVAGYLAFDVVRLRVDTWINPWPEADDRAFQIVQSLLAVAAGGILGDGVGQGAPTFIPVVHSDFVFAAIAEEWGMLGALGVVLCFAVLVYRAISIAIKNDSRPFHSLLAAGIGLALAVQSLLIMAGVLKIIPLTGVTLPFVSYGGSSMLSSFIMIGLLLRISDPDHQLPMFRSSRFRPDTLTGEKVV